MWLLHIATLSSCLSHTGLAVHFHQASQILVSSVSPNTFYIQILPLQLLVLFFSNEVHFSSWLLWTFASMPPGNWSYFGWSDHQSMYSGSFFPPWLVIHSTSASYRTALSLSFRIRTIACLVCILCLSSLYLKFHFLVSSELKCVCANFVDFFLLHLELNFKFTIYKLIQFLVVHVIVSLVFVLFVLNSCFHKRELFIQTNFILWKTFLHHSSVLATRLSYYTYEQWYTVWQYYRCDLKKTKTKKPFNSCLIL